MDPVPTLPLLDSGMKKVVGINLMGLKSAKKKDGKEGLIPALMNAFYLIMEQMVKKEDNHQLFILNPRFEPDPTRMLALQNGKKITKSAKR